MQEALDPYRPDPEARQFSIRRLLILAAICALIAGTGQVLELSPNGRIIFTFWWMALAAYIVFRVPYVVLALLGRTGRWKRLKAHRAELEEMAAQKRKEFRERQQGDEEGS